MGWRSSFADTNGISTHYIAHPTAAEQPIVFIHGETDNSACLQPVANAVVDLASPVLYDVRGHGLSDARPREYDRETLVRDCIEFCGTVCNKRPVLYGHSLGAEIAAVAAREVPNAGLVLEAPPAALTSETEDGKAELLEQCEDWRTTSHDALERQFEKDAPKFADALATARKQVRPEMADVRSWPYTPLDDLVADTTTPTLVLRADEAVVEYAVPDDEVARENEAVTRHVIDNASHTIARDEYAQTVGILRGFLSQRTS